MQKLIFSLLVGLFLISASAYRSAEAPALNSVKIVNDTKNDIRIYTGQAHVMLTRGGGSTSVSCEAGRKIYTSNGSKKGSLIFAIDTDMCGKTVKLSAYL